MPQCYFTTRFYVLVFTCILLILSVLIYVSSNLPYSPLFKVWDETYWETNALYKNEQRLINARSYLSTLDPTENHRNYTLKLRNKIDLLFAVITYDRKKEGTSYLTQVLARLDEELKTAEASSSSLLVCDVNPANEDVNEVSEISRYFPVFHIWQQKQGASHNLREKEKNDYVNCLEEAFLKFHFKFVIILEDDALPHYGFIKAIRHNLMWKVTRKISRGELTDRSDNWAFLKLYYPEKWKGFGLDFLSLTDLICHSLVVATATSTLTSSKRFVIGFAVAIASQLAIGRHYVTKYRQLSPYFSQVIDAPGCCTPAVLYPHHVLPDLMLYMKGVQCSSDYSLDIALDDFADSRHSKRLLVEPNLVEHIGMYSTLTDPKDAWYF